METTKDNENKVFTPPNIISGLAFLVAAFSLIISFFSYSTQKSALKSEMRPYLTMQLHPGEYLISNNDGQVFVNDFLVGNGADYLPIPVSWRNVGKIPALNIEAEYEGPVQKYKFLSALDSNDVAPEAESGSHVPYINVTGVKDRNKFETVLRVKYCGNSDIDPRTYTSSLLLRFEKTDKGFFNLNWSKYSYGFDDSEVKGN